MSTTAATKTGKGLSLWIVPPESYKPGSLLKELTTNTFPSYFRGSPAFVPHVTLTADIPESTQNLLPTMDLASIPPPLVEFAYLGYGEGFFKGIFLTIKQTDSLLALVRHARECLHQVPLENTFYWPHMSLAYVDEKPTADQLKHVENEAKEAIGHSPGWKGGSVWLVDTSPIVAEWKVLEKFTFSEDV
jgi:2'-5' RNA ligase